MGQVLTAMYKGGVFRPLEPVDLDEPSMVELQIRPAEEDLSTPYHPSKLKEWTEKYELSPDVTEMLTEDWTTGLTLNEVLALNDFVGMGGALSPGTDIEDLNSREDIWDAE